MPTYAEYVAEANAKGFQPVGETAFKALVRAGFDPVKRVWKAAGNAALAAH